MSRSATSSRASGRSSIWARRALPAILCLLIAGGAPLAARVFLTVDEAVKLAFPGCQVERHTAYLTAEQKRRAHELSGVEIPSALVTSYRASRNGQPVGTAYFDTHRVRTLPETVMVVVDPQGKVARVEVISFEEPEQYLPRGPWYGQFGGRELGPDLDLKRGIHPVTGATLTARATTEAVRRVLALHQVVTGGGGGGAKGSP
jgi:Na+-translocating ferredoxin:NAD+ oxidoreductase RnfG subunit